MTDREIKMKKNKQRDRQKWEKGSRLGVAEGEENKTWRGQLEAVIRDASQACSVC